MRAFFVSIIATIGLFITARAEETTTAVPIRGYGAYSFGQKIVAPKGKKLHHETLSTGAKVSDFEFNDKLTFNSQTLPVIVNVAAVDDGTIGGVSIVADTTGIDLETLSFWVKGLHETLKSKYAANPWKHDRMFYQYDAEYGLGWWGLAQVEDAAKNNIQLTWRGHEFRLLYQTEAFSKAFEDTTATETAVDSQKL